MITAEDLEIFVLTYNRAELLEQTLISICKQTRQGFRTIVLDNKSSDNTLDIVAKYSEAGIDACVNDENIGSLGSTRRVQQLASRKYVMLFHDDDLMHPRYIEDALMALNSTVHVTLVGGKWLPEEYPTNDYWAEVRPQLQVFEKTAAFASYLYSSNNFHFGSSIYRTDAFKKVFLDADTFGKILDRPILLEVASQGTTILLDDQYIKYRIHANQDTNDSTNGPFLPEVIALNRKYRLIMGASLLSPSGRMFIRKNYSCLYGNYSWCSDRKQQSFSRFLFEAYRNKAASLLSLMVGAGINLVAAPLKRLLLQERKKQ